MSIDASSYPHIVDAIIVAALPLFPARTVLKLRQLSKHTCELADDYIFSHIVLDGNNTFLACTKGGEAGFNMDRWWSKIHRCPARRGTTRVLDIIVIEQLAHGSSEEFDPDVSSYVEILSPHIVRQHDCHATCSMSLSDPAKSPHTLIQFLSRLVETENVPPFCLTTALPVKKLVINTSGPFDDHLDMWGNWSLPWPTSLEEAVIIFSPKDIDFTPQFEDELVGIDRDPDLYDNKLLFEPFIKLILTTPKIPHIIVGLEQVYTEFLDGESEETKRHVWTTRRRILATYLEERRVEDDYPVPDEPILFLTSDDYRERVGEEVFQREIVI